MLNVLNSIHQYPLNFWRKYKSAINVKASLHDIFIRQNQRYATLDGVRAIAVLLMVLFHVLFGSAILLKHNGIEPLDNFIVNFPRYLGWLWQSQGSDPLFILCGLLVSTAIFKEYEVTGRIKILTFYKRRLMRVLPLFCLAVILLLPTDVDFLRYLWSNILFISHYVPHHRPIIPVGWSLDVQMQFYALLPFFILLLFAFKWRIPLLIAAIAASFLWRYNLVVAHPELFKQPLYKIIYDKEFATLVGNTLYYPIDARIGNFLLGILIAYLHFFYAHQIKYFLSQHVLLNALLLIIAIALIVFCLSIPIENQRSWYYQAYKPEWGKWFLAFDRYLYCVGLSLLVLLALCPVGMSKWVEWVFSWKVWHPFAQLIFPIYLFHFLFLIIAAVITFHTTDRNLILEIDTIHVFILFFWTVLLTMLFSILVHIYIEKPFLVLSS